MTERRRPMLADLKDEIGSLGADLKELGRLRWELANVELREAAGTVKRLAICLLVVGVMAVGALPILVVALAQSLDKRLGISSTGWLLIFGFGLLIGGAAVGYFAWRRFRRRFAGMEQTIEELREDLVWLKQWSARGEEPQS